MTRIDLPGISVRMIVLATAALMLAPAALAQEKAPEEPREKTYRFEFNMDDDFPKEMHDFAVHFDPPDLSAFEDLHLRIEEPLRVLSRLDVGHLAEEHRQIAELEKESRELARRAQEADGAERTQLQAELRSTLEEIFEKKMELRSERISRLEEELREERENLRRRSEAREEMIERRLQRLMGEDDALDW